jgi:putative ABC transport system permease protein
MTGSAPRAYPFAARLARREVRRRPWRTLLVALLVAGPVAATMVAAVLVRTDSGSPPRDWRQRAGQADAMLVADSGPPALPAGAVAQPFRVDYGYVRTAGPRRAYAQITDLAPDAPLARGIYYRVSGRSPRDAGEVVLSRHAAALLHAHLGDRVTFEKPWAATVSVVGLADMAAYRSADFIVVAPASALSPRVPVTYLVRLPASMTMAQRVSWARSALAYFPGTAAKQGVDGATFAPAIARRLGGPRQDAPDDRTAQVAFTWVACAAALAVVGIVVASAFAAGGRRQLTMLGQLAANGAGPAVLRRVLLLQGTWTGIAGAAAGLAGGAALLAALVPYRYDLLGRDVGSYVVRPLDVGPIALLAVVAATVAALVPARTASRTPVLSALAGRRPLGAVPRWLAPAGVAASAAGLGLLALAVLGATASDTSRGGPGTTRVWAATGALGAVTVLLGACAVAPRWVGVLDRLAVRLHGAWRFAARSLARQRTRTAAVVSATCVTTALALAASAVVLAAVQRERNAPTYVARNQVHVAASVVMRTSAVVVVPKPAAAPADLVAAVAGAVPRAHRIDVPQLAGPVRGGSGAGPVPVDETSAAVATEEVLRLYGADAAVRRGLATTGAVQFGGDERHATLRDATGEIVAVTVVDVTAYSLGALPPVLVTPAVAARLGWHAAPPVVVFEQPRRLTDDEARAVQDVYLEWNDAHAGPVPRTRPERIVSVDAAQPDGAHPPGPLVLDGLLASAALAFTLFFVATSLALAAAETRDERDALSVAGAGTRVLRRTSGRKALLVTTLGALLGVPVGLVPVLVLLHVAPHAPPFVVPWTVLALLVVAVPLVAAAVTTGASAIALRLRPVRVSTMAYD